MHPCIPATTQMINLQKKLLITEDYAVCIQRSTCRRLYTLLIDDKVLADVYKKQFLDEVRQESQKYDLDLTNTIQTSFHEFIHRSGIFHHDRFVVS